MSTLTLGCALPQSLGQAGPAALQAWELEEDLLTQRGRGHWDQKEEQFQELCGRLKA